MTTSKAPPTSKTATETQTPTPTPTALGIMEEMTHPTPMETAMALQTPTPRIRTREVEDMEEAATTTIMTRAEGYTAHLIQNRTRTQAAEGTEEITTTMRGQETQTPIRTRMEGAMEVAVMTMRTRILTRTLRVVLVDREAQADMRVR